MHTATQDNSGTRDVCDFGLGSIEVLDGPDAWQDHLEPGDLLFFRTDGNWLSRLIASLDGYWSHTALYVGDLRIVHAYTAGIGELDLPSIVAKYPAGVATARPLRSPAQRQAAAAWARTKANEASNPDKPLYSGRDLGMAFAMLRRARRRGAAHKLPRLSDDDIDDENDNDARMLAQLADQEGILRRAAFESTCSGLLYRAYDEGANAPLQFRPAPGLHREGNYLALPAGLDDPDLFEALQADDDLEALDWQRWKNKVTLLAGAAIGWTSVVPLNGRVSVAAGVTPGDLWCCADVADRRFLLDEHRDYARTQTAHCT